MVDCARCRLLWPEEVSLKEEIQAKHHECELNCMKKELEKASVKSTPTDITSITVREPKRVCFKEKYPKADIALIGAAEFNRSVKSKEDEVFITSLSKIKKAIEDKERPGEDHLEEEEIKQHLPEWYHEFADVFSKIKSNKLPERKEYNHKIELEKEVELGYCPLYRMSAEELYAAKDYIVENLDKGFIMLSNALFASPILIAKKPRGRLRFCVDYQQCHGPGSTLVKQRCVVIR
ncbi:hypothetical protein TSTA_010960 [Talaromyces stipitatus ATCC 10500]|uniref:Reverse transcriptase/retrotransposon-derived protein RNase H-like domain-containing protein n=1 Tax=Talaromyces stipitatus (strain ATCC 10500 / CBS 375.48 / QM 6759 / NRRL 1006) TaxID=441959 RepID=B8MHJ9_TALSN|nr:uncharacterized protein TSTA_010960 [Talaromyces stipitatus ATCC 10500]EED15980.1 hypothetical protein TSTA_010960 [Talaromyces stipitatus ATCC 10500]